jgi:propionyl-CoA carboxylase alpha chain
MGRDIRTLLIANRGEIARRIERTAREMGIRTVAVYAESDANAPFVREADAAIALGGRTSAETYLDIGKILAAAGQAGADAIHPGYGFLSEKAEFARAVEAADLVWVGPPPTAIAAMGDKLAGKRLIIGARVPTLPAMTLAADEDVRAAARHIGFPLLVKAAAGGGGKGMRVVADVDAVEGAVEGARREARSAFGDDTVFLERYLARSRHIEIQVLGDSHGNLVHCFERECSIQRRHQKIIEEAPSLAVSPGLREKMGAAAVAAAAAVNYASAGTVEFLLDGEEFWFLEMNTRLQVEHPVTEAITGLDLVREQLLIAMGERLSVKQGDLVVTGHAIEARLYAEDPERDFLPVIGPVLRWQPAAAPKVRFDSGIETGSVIGLEFDPMLAKVVAHAPNRREAALKLAKALEETRFVGPVSNRDFLVTVLRHSNFLAGDTTTDFIPRVAPPRARVLSPEDMRVAAILLALWAQATNRAAARVLAFAPSGWRNTPLPPQRLALRYRAQEMAVAYSARRDGSFAVNAGSDSIARVLHIGDGRIEAEIDGIRHAADVLANDGGWFVSFAGGDHRFAEVPRFPDRTASVPRGALTAPMPGRVVAVRVEAGAAVEAGETLLLLEAMKLEHHITAPAAGIVRELRVALGDQVASGALLAVVAEASGE